MSRNPVDWFEIYVTDMKRARAFYEAVFDAKLERNDSTVSAISEMWLLPMQRDVPGAAGALVKMQGGPEGGGASTIVYFTCEDCAVEAGRAAKNGGSVMKQKVSIGEHGFIALVKDTEGNVIGLHSRK
jgi:predicted enzyme related to lactoylglutathione lyase